MIKFFECTKKMEHEKKYDIFNTWAIKRVKESAGVGEDGRIDEDEVDLSDIDVGDEESEDGGQS